MGGAAVQIAFNLGNAIGATVGGIALSKTGFPVTASLYGTALAAVSILTILFFLQKKRALSQRPLCKQTY